MTTIATTATANGLLATLAAHRRRYGAAFDRFMAGASSARSATDRLAWLLQAYAVAGAWQSEDQDAWADWADSQDWESMDYQVVQPRLHDSAVAAGRDGHQAQREASQAIQEAHNPDWEQVGAAIPRLASEPAYTTVFAGWNAHVPAWMLENAWHSHRPS